jgi:Mce-associated membrane protein
MAAIPDGSRPDLGVHRTLPAAQAGSLWGQCARTAAPYRGAAIAIEADATDVAELPPVRRVSPSRSRRAVAAVLATLVALTGWLGWRDLEVRRAEDLRAAMVQAGRDGVLALTSIDYERVDEDVQRILDSSTGLFRDDFAVRADSFKAAARQAQSKSVGTVTEAGVETVDGDQGRVLVTLVVMTSNRGAPEQQPKVWRTRVSVVKESDAFKVAAVEFI